MKPAIKRTIKSVAKDFGLASLMIIIGAVLFIFAASIVAIIFSISAKIACDYVMAGIVIFIIVLVIHNTYKKEKAKENDTKS